MVWEAPDVTFPLVGVRVIQATLAVALQPSVPPPVLETVTFWRVGLGPPTGAEYVRVAGLRPMVGTALTVRVTATVWGELETPAALTVIVPLYEPGVRPVTSTVTVIDCEAPAPRLPPVGERLSQGALSEADHARVPPPVLLTVTA